MSSTVYYVLSAILSIGVLLGIRWMSKVETAVRGNRLSAACMLLAVAIVLFKEQILGVWTIWLGILIGSGLGVVMAHRVKMISMPQMVALLNGLGGLASAAAAWLTLEKGGLNVFSAITAMLALLVGTLTFSGSMVAAGKLHRVLPQQPIRVNNHGQFTGMLAAMMPVLLVVAIFTQNIWVLAVAAVLGLAFGLMFALPVGGADMPITISLLNSTSGVAAAIAGMAIGDALLVAVGGIVGASGLLLTQIMCRAMNRKLSAILFGKAPGKAAPVSKQPEPAPQPSTPEAPEAQVVETPAAKEEVAQAPVQTAEETEEAKLADWILEARDVIIIPGYGMAVSQAQGLLKQLHDKLAGEGKRVRFAIHPVAGRMPGHMNVLLAEVDIPYDELYEMDDINPDMGSADLVIVVGANDVINPAANTAEDTPIYGMPVLNAEQAKRLIICNFDTQPGYAGVPNPLYEPSPHINLLLGDAKDSIQKMLDASPAKKKAAAQPEAEEHGLSDWLQEAKDVIIIPGYGMAVSQAQGLLKQLHDKLAGEGKRVRFAIHPVAGRMPGHMNVLLAEVDIPYDELYEMDDINPDMGSADLVIVVGANDVINPAANTAEDTPIYGMPVLNAEQAKRLIICNFDTQPGYAGVPNPLYDPSPHINLLLGDAKDSIQKMLDAASAEKKAAAQPDAEENQLGDWLKEARDVIIIPGYGMAVSQAQGLLKQLHDKLAGEGKRVRFAIHPVAGRMPGHMNVLLAEVDIPYDELYEMDDINPDMGSADLVIVVGANDVINPAANTAEDTPIYGMPVLNAEQAKRLIICNFDTQPGYAGVPNPLYDPSPRIILLLGDAKGSIQEMLDAAE